MGRCLMEEYEGGVTGVGEVIVRSLRGVEGPWRPTLESRSKALGVGCLELERRSFMRLSRRRLSNRMRKSWAHSSPYEPSAGAGLKASLLPAMVREEVVVG